MSTLLRARGALPFAALCAAAHGLGAQVEAQATATSAVTCEVRTIAAARFTTCEIPPDALGELQIAPAPHPSARSWTIARLDSTLRASGMQLVMATNAGIYGHDGRPLGLLVSRGQEATPLDVSAGPEAPPGGSVCDISNFHCPPNGVFYIAEGRAGVERTEAYRRGVAGQGAVRLATQSGPLLVEHGQLAREFPESWRRRIARNAACVRGDGSVVLALGEGQTHRSFAMALRESLGCRDALYLDGSISAMYAGGCLPPEDADYAAIIYVAVPLTERSGRSCSTAKSALVRAEAYSSLTVRVGATTTRTPEQARASQPRDWGAAAQVEMPFRFGRLGVTLDQVTLRSNGADVADARRRQVAMDWRADVPLLRGVLVQPGVRMGTMDMEKFLAGPTVAIALPLTERLALTGERAWLFQPGAGGERLGNFSAFIAHTWRTPRAWRRALR